MKLYRVHYSDSRDSSLGFEFFLQEKQALEAMAAFCETNECANPKLLSINVKFSSEGVLRALNRYATHPDNG